MSRPEHSFTEIAGVPVHYDRFPDPRYSYGTRGKPMRFHATKDFHDTLNRAFEELWEVCPLGKAEVITTAGAYVAKPGSHGLGRGFDIDGIFWKDKTFITLHYPQDRRFYAAVEAVLRKHFGNVLNYEYDAAHQDHFHVDDLTAPSFRTTSRARVLFLQMAVTNFFDRPVAIDGRIGSETNSAARGAVIDLGLANPSAVADDAKLHAKLAKVWPDFLGGSAGRGFEGSALDPAATEPTPADLIDNVYAVLARELGATAARKQVETALTTFAEHEQTSQWLEKFR
jgi:hypothetical protein